jgi:hypothetical protein
VIRALGLTAEQEDKIDAHIRELPRPNPNVKVVPLAGGPGASGLGRGIDAGWTAALKVLTPDQRTRWDALIGKRLPTEELQKVQGCPDLKDILDLLPPMNPTGNLLPPGVPPGP